ncbi:hypothetical protein A1O1_01021 [Capronia coronata CBS 617.96]|uniref:RRM domain-containing protein n=1 Tax=Capronia coronata CBS 617.96 TaxID=1182541 RepID=W9Z2W2_9EURO|nr:uncharacterized protein A1O1_01021 [Capronia coronata CBS 617.96]EXJ95896.1 hypothetical protein A1O1_01021 [Capronia coronata CBS 617.96]
MSKKRKRDQEESEALPGQAQTATTTQPDDASAQIKSEKKKGRSRQERSERRSKKAKKLNATAQGDTVSPPDNAAGDLDLEMKVQAADQDQHTVDGESSQSLPKKAKKSKSADNNDEKLTTSASSRFIVFVGNLPFDATASQVKDHFAKLVPSSVRLSTDKATGKGKGFAFIEFDAYDKMKTCLKLYHHSLFDPHGEENAGDPGAKAAKGKRKPRRINVELTAGGGGKKSQERMSKIKTKNEKLNEERKRRSIQEKIDQDKAAAKSKKAPVTGANAAEASETAEDGRGAIHPSRLSRVMQ